MRTIKKKDITQKVSNEEINELVDSKGQEIQGSSDGTNTDEIGASTTTDKHKSSTLQGPRFMFNYGGMEYNGAASKNKSVDNINDYTVDESEVKMNEMLEELLLDKDDKTDIIKKELNGLVTKVINKLYDE